MEVPTDSKSASKTDIGSIDPSEQEIGQHASIPMAAEDIELEGQESPMNWRPLPKCVSRHHRTENEYNLANDSINRRVRHDPSRAHLRNRRIQLQRSDTCTACHRASFPCQRSSIQPGLDLVFARMCFWAVDPGAALRTMVRSRREVVNVPELTTLGDGTRSTTLPT